MVNNSAKMRTMSLGYLLHLSPARRRILDSISAFDAAKLVSLRVCFLSAKERERYLNPIRDLVWDVPGVERLSRQGMQLTLLGDSGYVLEQRLHATERFLRSHGNDRLTVYLLGTFPILTPTERTLHSLVEFSITGDSSLVRSHGDKYQLGRIRALRGTDTERTFIMSFNAPMQASPSLSKGYWYKVDDVPDRTIDLWVYVPSFRDRIQEEVRLTPRDILRIVRARPLAVPPSLVPPQATSSTSRVRRTLRNAAWYSLSHVKDTVWTLGQLSGLCTGICHLEKWSLTAAGIRSMGAPSLAQLRDNKGHRYQRPPFERPILSIDSGSRTAIEVMQAPNIQLFLNIAYQNTTGWRVAVT